MTKTEIYLLGYVLEKDGTHYGYVELTDYKQLANFINDNPTKNKMITDVMDLPVITTIGNFLDRMDISKIDRDKLLKELLHLQKDWFGE